MIFWEFSNQAAAAIFSIKLGMREVYSEPIQNISRNTRSRIGCFYFHIIIFNNKQRLHLIIKMFAIKFFILSAPSNSSMLRVLSSFWGFFLVDVLYKGALSAKAYPPPSWIDAWLPCNLSCIFSLQHKDVPNNWLQKFGKLSGKCLWWSLFYQSCKPVGPMYKLQLYYKQTSEEITFGIFSWKLAVLTRIFWEESLWCIMYLRYNKVVAL